LSPVAFLALENNRTDLISAPWNTTTETLNVSQFRNYLIHLDDKSKWRLKPNSSTRIQRKQHYFFQNMCTIQGSLWEDEVNNKTVTDTAWILRTLTKQRGRVEFCLSFCGEV
jgi:hypothetical protein